MEIIVVLVVILVLCKVLGVSNEMIIMGILALTGLTIVAMLLFFVFFCLQLLFAKRKKGRFSRIGKPEGGKFAVAYYYIDGVEYPCVFPKESFTTKKTYCAERESTLFYSKILKKVFDIWAVITCIVGLFFSVFAVLFTLRLLAWLVEF